MMALCSTKLDYHGAGNHKNRTIILGSVGVGKSSLVNLLVHSNAAQVRDSARGCTFRCEPYSATYNDTNYTLFDTIGLNEGEKGTVSCFNAIKNLIDFIHSDRNGFNLLVFVMKKGRLTYDFEQTHKLFYEILFEEKLNAILFISSCEDYEPMNQWIERAENKEAFENFNFKKIICGTTIDHSSEDSKRKKTYVDMWEAIQKYQLKQPCRLGNHLSIIQEAINFVWKFFFREPLFKSSKLNKLNECLKSMGFNELQITELINMLNSTDQH